MRRYVLVCVCVCVSHSKRHHFPTLTFSGQRKDVVNFKCVFAGATVSVSLLLLLLFPLPDTRFYIALFSALEQTHCVAGV